MQVTLIKFGVEFMNGAVVPVDLVCSHDRIGRLRRTRSLNHLLRELFWGDSNLRDSCERSHSGEHHKKHQYTRFFGLMYCMSFVSVNSWTGR